MKPESQLKNGHRLTVPSLLLLVLEAGPIRGKTKLQSEVFLAWQEVFGDNTLDPMFHPDQFGPFSQILVDTQIVLKTEGKIKIVSRGEGHKTYVILPSGKDALNAELERTTFPKDSIQLLEKKKADWNEWTTRGILRYIYRQYPYYANTRVKELIWDLN